MNSINLTASQIHRMAILAPNSREQVLHLVGMQMSFAYAFAIVNA